VDLHASHQIDFLVATAVRRGRCLQQGHRIGPHAKSDVHLFKLICPWNVPYPVALPVAKSIVSNLTIVKVPVVGPHEQNAVNRWMTSAAALSSTRFSETKARSRSHAPQLQVPTVARPRNQIFNCPEDIAKPLESAWRDVARGTLEAVAIGLEIPFVSRWRRVLTAAEAGPLSAARPEGRAAAWLTARARRDPRRAAGRSGRYQLQ
jgi:hypothetical protein